MSFSGYTIKELEEKLHKKELSATDVVDMAYKRIDEVEDQVQAFITLDEENARQKAKELDEAGSNGEKLFAIPVGIKDNIVSKGVRTTCGSKILENFNDPLYDATVVERLNNEKSIMLGKLNLDEFAMGSTTETSYYQKTRNPWNTECIPGGSSGGSAAAVAAGEVLFALGTDTGGSVRQPASYCGVVGMKPTYGLVSRHGAVQMSASLDVVGPITKNVEDNARILEIIAGHDKMDHTTASHSIPSYTDVLKGDIKGMKIAVPEEFFMEGISSDVKETVMNALQMYELLGAKIDKVSLPHAKYAAAVYSMIMAAEASTSLARYDGVRYGYRSDNIENMIDMMKHTRGEGFGEEAKRRILLGSHILSAGSFEAYFEKAQKVRTLIRQDFDKVFADYDVIVGPTTPAAAFKLGEKNRNIKEIEAGDLLTVPVNIAGVPGISLPCGFTEEGMPLGLQIIGKHFDESTIYRAAYAYEQATNHHKKRPVLEGASK
ncbi:Asp-tRNA(Asn)/Glu-tRNA(Gln) amidotransferase subunit GatA [Ornithinibacillus sp. 4-3]|uniref:Glutamyl-tRNA(Gln) amidotransferase subunit A n=1 Tax=Ornithinibacillus sp. 4-3 TaxID=3231488 RepID=A0AB39HQ61_9BACI